MLEYAAIAITLVGMLLSVASRKVLADNWSKDAALVENQQLVTNGPYRLVRHPIYTGFLLWSLERVCSQRNIQCLFYY